MAKFDRWKHAWSHSGPFQVYKQYYEELNSYYETPGQVPVSRKKELSCRQKCLRLNFFYKFS